MAIGTKETNKLDERKPMQLKGKTVRMNSVHLEEKNNTYIFLPPAENSA